MTDSITPPCGFKIPNQSTDRSSWLPTVTSNRTLKTEMSNARRFAAVFLMLLSQVAGGLVVICDEGVFGQIMEFLPQFCCEAQVDSSPALPAGSQEQDPCGPCYDTPLVSFIQLADELQGSAQFELNYVATLEDTPLAQLLCCGAVACDMTSQAAISTTVGQLAGTVVLLC